MTNDNKRNIGIIGGKVSGGGGGTVTWDDIEDKPSFATVATSGSYNDLSNTPSIPTKTSDLTNDSGFITGADWDDITNKPVFATVATSGSYSDLSNTPSIPTKTSDLTNDSGYITGVAWNDVTDKPSFATVATSGDYTDLINTPTIPAAPVQSDWNESNSSSLAYIANKPTIPASPVQTDWSEYDSASLAYLANRPSWIRNTQQWTLEDDQQVSKGIPMVVTNSYQWGLGVNEVIAPAYNRTATTDLLTVKTTNSNGDTITDTIMHVGTNGVYAPTFYENNVSLANKYIAQGGVTAVWTGTQSQYDNLGSYSSTTLYLITAS